MIGPQNLLLSKWRTAKNDRFCYIFLIFFQYKLPIGLKLIVRYRKICHRQPPIDLGPPKVDQDQFETIMYNHSEKFTFLLHLSRFSLRKSYIRGSNTNKGRPADSIHQFEWKLVESQFSSMISIWIFRIFLTV